MRRPFVDRETHHPFVEEPEIEAMVDGVVELTGAIRRGHRTGTMSDEQIVECGDRQAELVHELLQCCGSPTDVAELSDELHMSFSVLLSLNTLYLASVDGARIANPTLN